MKKKLIAVILSSTSLPLVSGQDLVSQKIIGISPVESSRDMNNINGQLGWGIDKFGNLHLVSQYRGLTKVLVPATTEDKAKPVVKERKSLFGQLISEVEYKAVASNKPTIIDGKYVNYMNGLLPALILKDIQLDQNLVQTDSTYNLLGVYPYPDDATLTLVSNESGKAAIEEAGFSFDKAYPSKLTPLNLTDAYPYLALNDTSVVPVFKEYSKNITILVPKLSNSIYYTGGQTGSLYSGFARYYKGVNYEQNTTPIDLSIHYPAMKDQDIHHIQPMNGSTIIFSRNRIEDKELKNDQRQLNVFVLNQNLEKIEEKTITFEDSREFQRYVPVFDNTGAQVGGVAIFSYHKKAPKSLLNTNFNAYDLVYIDSSGKVKQTKRFNLQGGNGKKYEQLIHPMIGSIDKDDKITMLSQMSAGFLKTNLTSHTFDFQSDAEVVPQLIEDDNLKHVVNSIQSLGMDPRTPLFFQSDGSNLWVGYTISERVGQAVVGQAPDYTYSGVSFSGIQMKSLKGIPSKTISFAATKDKPSVVLLAAENGVAKYVIAKANDVRYVQFDENGGNEKNIINPLMIEYPRAQNFGAVQTPNVIVDGERRCFYILGHHKDLQKNHSLDKVLVTKFSF